MIHQVIDELVATGIAARQICYLSVDHPLYNDCGLLDLVELFREATHASGTQGTTFVFFDEIQYLRNWEVHLKTLVDSHPHLKIVASGSAAAALKLKSLESGAGRFSDFLLPPLTFYEYLDLLNKSQLVEVTSTEGGGRAFHPTNIDELNRAFLEYLNYGGYPEALFSETIRRDPARFIKSDIVDKVLLRDLPSLYGIQDIQELNALFTSLAFNTANEVSLEGLSRNSGVAKNTIKRYLEYLEAAFLIRVIHRIDRTGKRFQRANFFKVYLTNPSMRSALFSPLSSEDPEMGHLAETGVFSQWFHGSLALTYARWSSGEVDIVCLHNNKPRWAVEVKWTDRFTDRPAELRGFVEFCKTNKVDEAQVTTRGIEEISEIDGLTVRFVPVSLYCFKLGYNIIRGKQEASLVDIADAADSPRLPGL